MTDLEVFANHPAPEFQLGQTVFFYQNGIIVVGVIDGITATYNNRPSPNNLEKWVYQFVGWSYDVSYYAAYERHASRRLPPTRLFSSQTDAIKHKIRKLEREVAENESILNLLQT